MRDETERKSASDADPLKVDGGTASQANMITLEVCFLAAIGLTVIAAFFEALTYELVSSRTPFVIMAPLFVLIVIHAKRLASIWRQSDFTRRIGLAFTGGLKELNKVVVISVWMSLLLLGILCLGHYVGILAFAVVMVRGVAGKKFTTALLIAGVTTFLIFAVFEVGFGVELYRGLFFRYLSGYRDF